MKGIDIPLSPDEVYDAVMELAEELHCAGEAAWAERLADALAISSVSGEVWGETSRQLMALRANPIAQRLQVRGRIDNLLPAVRALLPR